MLPLQFIYTRFAAVEYSFRLPRLRVIVSVTSRKRIFLKNNLICKQAVFLTIHRRHQRNKNNRVEVVETQYGERRRKSGIDVVG